MKRCIGSANPHRAVFRFFARYYDAEEVIHNRISRNWEDISNSGPKAMPKIIINWTFNEKLHRIRKTSQSRFSLFGKILQCWSSDSPARFLKAMPKTIKNWNFNENGCRIGKSSQSRISLFCKILRCWSSDSSAHFLKLRRYLKLWPQGYAKNYIKLNF